MRCRPMSDYLSRDPEMATGPAASTPHVELVSAGETLHGVLHLPGGDGPHPVVLLLHGFPGWERNLDLAQALRRAGYAALVFHYRGCWGMPGTWSWGHALEDARTVLGLILEGEIGGSGVLDPARVAVVGHSVGGFLALAASSEFPSVRVAGSVSGFDFGAVAQAIREDPGLRESYVRVFDAEVGVLSGTDGESLADEMQAAGDEWSLGRLAPAFAGRHVLLVGTGLDDVTPSALHHDPLVRAFESQADVGLSHVVFPTDHALSDHRIALTRRVVEFVDAHL